MAQNNAMESSTLALTGLNVVIEDECDYVFVAGDDELLDEWEDDDSYDHCDLSPSLSCATSVATNITLRDLNLIEDSAMMMDVDEENEPTAMDTEETEGGSNRMMNEGTAASRNFPSSTANPKNGRRLSNKKIRKKMKMMKKAAALRTAAEALANQQAAAAMSGSSSSESTAASLPPVAPSSSERKSSSPKRKSARSMNSNNLAVACAQGSLAAYREEIEAGKVREKKARAVSIDVA